MRNAWVFVTDGLGWGRLHIADRDPVGPKGHSMAASWCGRWANYPAGPPKVKLTSVQRVLKRAGVEPYIWQKQQPKHYEWERQEDEYRSPDMICGRCEKVARSRGIAIVEPERPNRAAPADHDGRPTTALADAI